MPLPIDPRAQQQMQPTLQAIQNGQRQQYPFPPNIAGIIPLPLRQRIFKWMLDNYIWPQAQARRIYEDEWDRMLEMARASLKYTSDLTEPDTKVRRRIQENLRALEDNKAEGKDLSVGQRLEISDTVIYDAIDRLTNLNHFICFKESLPVQFAMPEDVEYPHENDVYSPSSAMVKSANAWMKFLAQGQNVYRKGWQVARHHYTYGVSFVDSQYTQRIDMVPRRQADNTFQPMPELADVGITFEPLSLRKLWLNTRLPVYDMQYQACPFFFDEMPRFAIIAKPYDANNNPFGFANTDKIPKAQWLFGSAETASWQKGMSERNRSIDPLTIMKPEYDVELLWTFYTMLPLGINPSLPDDPENPNKYEFDDTGDLGIPMSRWIMQSFGNQLCTGQMEIVRLQRNFYPNDSLPLYGSAHMPTLDDGAYPMAIGNILENHYKVICKTMIQYMDNKDLLNDPPTKIMANSPAMAYDLNKKGAKVPVNTLNDYEKQAITDSTNTTPAFLAMVRDEAKTSSKATEAILGQALGSRTSATEAQNVFQTAMSGVTTDVNLFSYDIFGGWGQRVWDYTGRWVDPELLQAITGSFGFALTPAHMALRIGLKTDIGSSFIESITMQQNVRYALESSVGDPTINRAYLWKELMRKWRFKDVDRIVNDQGQEDSIQIATEQCIQVYLGQLVLVDPDQDHQVAIKVIKSFLQDRKSVWNTNPMYAPNAQKLVPLMQQHYLFLQMQMMQQQLQQQRMMLGQGDALQPLQSQQPAVTTPGQQAQQQGQAMNQ